ncbi:MAG: helix-turn-helix transcriptional regulator [Gammaproteobacteria bacterium]|nr:helix-turn-helix transcriptional regulator [Gammaproteobacteria bacterium]
MKVKTIPSTRLVREGHRLDSKPFVMPGGAEKSADDFGIAHRVTRIREENKLTVKEFALKLGEKPYRINGVERGRQRAPGDMLAKISEIFRINGTWLLTGKASIRQQASSAIPATAEIDAHLEKLTETQRLRILLDIEEMGEANRQKEKLKQA